MPYLCPVGSYNIKFRVPEELQMHLLNKHSKAIIKEQKALLNGFPWLVPGRPQDYPTMEVLKKHT
jgi:hypothetical protein